MASEPAKTRPTVNRVARDVCSGSECGSVYDYSALASIMFAFVALRGVMVIAARNPVHSVLFLILAFLQCCGLFVLIGAEFLAMILVVVYVGAVAVLFLFVVMMLDINFVRAAPGVPAISADRRVGRLILLAELLVGADWRSRAEARIARLADATRSGHQYPGDRADDLHRLYLSVPGAGWFCWSP